MKWLRRTSASDSHRNGLANSSDQVGRNFMYHQADALLAISTDRNEDSYTKPWGTNDFYLRDIDTSYLYPLGQVQPVGSFHHEMMKGDLYVVDAACFVSASAVNPSLTIIANAIRIADHLLSERLTQLPCDSVDGSGAPHMVQGCMMSGIRQEKI